MQSDLASPGEHQRTTHLHFSAPWFWEVPFSSWERSLLHLPWLSVRKCHPRAPELGTRNAVGTPPWPPHSSGLRVLTESIRCGWAAVQARWIQVQLHFHRDHTPGSPTLDCSGQNPKAGKLPLKLFSFQLFPAGISKASSIIT